MRDQGAWWALPAANYVARLISRAKLRVGSGFEWGFLNVVREILPRGRDFGVIRDTSKR